jgi:hypothetical protein
VRVAVRVDHELDSSDHSHHLVGSDFCCENFSDLVFGGCHHGLHKVVHRLNRISVFSLTNHCSYNAPHLLNMCRLFNLLCLLHLLHRCFENLSLLLSHALLLGLVLLHPFLPPLLPLISLALTTPLATLLGHETRLPFVSASTADNNHYSGCLLAHPELSSMPLALRFNCLTNFDAVMANAHFSHLVETGLAPRTVDLLLHVSLTLWYLYELRRF